MFKEKTKYKSYDIRHDFYRKKTLWLTQVMHISNYISQFMKFRKEKKIIKHIWSQYPKNSWFLNVISNQMSVLELAKHPKSTQKNTAEKFSSLFPQILTYKATCLASRNLCQENSCRQKSSQSPHQAALLLDV